MKAEVTKGERVSVRLKDHNANRCIVEKMKQNDVYHSLAEKDGHAEQHESTGSGQNAQVSREERSRIR